MRLVLLSLALLLALGTAPAHAASIAFGSGSLSAPCSLAGNGADRSCTSTSSNTATTFNVRGQASADHGLTTNGDAIADVTLTYDIPYTVTRTVTINPGSSSTPATADFDLITLSFDMSFSGAVAADNTGLSNALMGTISFSSLSGYFTTATYSGLSHSNGSGTVNHSSPDRSYTATGVTFGRDPWDWSGVRRNETDTDNLGIPVDFRAWSDFQPPFQFNYSAGGTVNQSFSDTLRVTFRLRAESRPSGSISTTGGEAIACAGQSSTMGGFGIDDSLNCGSGFSVAASAIVSSTVNTPVPEPTSLALLVAGCAGLAALGSRHRTRRKDA